MAKVAFLGLGVMGYPMAGHLKTKGHDVTVYNRTVARAEKWVEEFGGRRVPAPSEAAKGQEFVFACVGNDDDLRAVTTGAEGAFESLEKSAVFVDHTTASAVVARELNSIANAQGFGFVDAPDGRRAVGFIEPHRAPGAVLRTHAFARIVPNLISATCAVGRRSQKPSSSRLSGGRRVAAAVKRLL
jgi:3-hydroxyisobutyrate dehydrogenase-like beta-hydroxyacid dehydrogenase